MRKGQVSFEFIVAVALMLVLFSAVSIDAYVKNRQAGEFKSFLHAKEVASVFAENVDSVAGAGGGFYRYFSLPVSLSGGYNYTITAGGGFADVVSDENLIVTELLSSRDVTVYCLDYAGRRLNRVENNNGSIRVTCSMPDLSVLSDRTLFRDGMLYAVIVNKAPVSSPGFGVSLEGSLQQVSGLSAEGEIVLEYNVSSFPSGSPVNLTVDSNGEVDESIEDNNDFEIMLP